MTPREMYEWRQKGATYQEIADDVGITRQAVYLKVKAYENKLKGSRGKVKLEGIVYKGLYDYFKNNENVKICKFAESVFGNAAHNVEKVRRFLYGETETQFKIRHIEKIIEITGKSFEELFERR